MDELFLGYKEFENIHDWVEGLDITIEVRHWWTKIVQNWHTQFEG
jgi:hypothetical protein